MLVLGYRHGDGEGGGGIVGDRIFFNMRPFGAFFLPVS